MGGFKVTDLGKKVRVFETDKPIKAPNFTPVKREVEVVERELVPVKTNAFT